MSASDQTAIDLLSNHAQGQELPATVPLVFNSGAETRQGASQGEFNRAKLLEVEIEVENLDASPEAGDFLDIFIQHTNNQNNANSWDDLIAFPQLTEADFGGGAGIKVIKSYVNSYLDPGNAVDIHTITDMTLTADTVRNVMIGRFLKVKAKSTSGTAINMKINRCEASYKE